MKQKVRLLMIMILAWNAANVNGQEKKEGKIVVEITKEIDGEKRTFKGEYDSAEEMRADPNYQEFAENENQFDFWFDNDHDMQHHLDHLKGLSKSFHFFDDDADNSFFKHFDGDSTDVHSFQFDTSDMEEFEEKMKDLGIEFELLMDRIEEDGDNQFQIITLKKIHISDVSGEEFGKKGKVSESNKLELENLTFSPNPSSNGRFKVKFRVLEEKDLNIRVYNLEGKEVFNRYFESFGGLYSETIDLSGQKEGIYLLEITQGGKRLTKKIAIN